jgi:ribosome recycling factor
MEEELFSRARQRFEQVVELAVEDLAGVQTGRAKPALVESVKVEAYEGSFMEVRELANISAPDPQSLIIKPWDPSTLKKIEVGLQKSDLGLSPVIDNDLIRIKMPSLTEERRQELVKQVKQKIEAGKAMLRQVRLEIKKEIDKQKDEAGISEDDIHSMYERLQELVDEFNDKLEKMEKNKEKELMAV